MPYTVGQSGVANYVNTTLTTVTRVVANGGVGAGGAVAVGGSNRVALSYTIAANVVNFDVAVDTLPGYILGKSDITVTVNAGVYASSIIQDRRALRILRASTGDTVKLVNNGYIAGWGGNGGGVETFDVTGCCSGYTASASLPDDGSLAFEYSTYSSAPLTIENNGYIGGGGGGGGAGFNDDSEHSYFSSGGGNGGGGAGGGISYSNPGFGYNRARATPTAPTGLNGNTIITGYDCVGVNFYQGGGGGFIFPGVGGFRASGSGVGIGGGSGGSGGLIYVGSYTPDNNGGDANQDAPNPAFGPVNSFIAGGGGGWGAKGGNGYVITNRYQFGAIGGPAIKTNGNTVTISTGLSRIYGTTVS
jgi:hypothetical protein